jgi:hypothetical protein
MTIVDSPKHTPEVGLIHTPEVDMAQLLFEEARQRRRRRWLISGIAVLFIAVALGVTLVLMAGREGRGSVQPVAPPPSAHTAVGSRASFSVRPVLCYAPPFAPTNGATTSTGALPPCAPSSELTAANLQVTPSGRGFTISPNYPNDTDPQFATYASTSPKQNEANAPVLLPGSASFMPPPPSGDQTRYVLGPAGLTRSGISSASAQHVAGMWIVNIELNGRGAAQWDVLSQVQFHAMVGIVVDGKVISAPIIQPVQVSFSSSGGQMQIAGGFNRHQAEALAARL